jgi:hypothetical protein
MEERLALHVDDAAVLGAKEEQDGRPHAAHMRDRGGRIQPRIELGRHLVALHRRTHAELGEVPVGDVRARWLRDDDRVAQHSRAERVRILPDDYVVVRDENAVRRRWNCGTGLTVCGEETAVATPGNELLTRAVLPLALLHQVVDGGLYVFHVESTTFPNQRLHIEISKSGRSRIIGHIQGDCISRQVVVCSIQSDTYILAMHMQRSRAKRP